MPLAEPARAAFPERLGRYDILSPIAQGGMSQVFWGRIVGPRGFERDVALKLLRELGQESGSIDPLAEAKLAAQIRHPNVVPVLDVGSTDDAFFLVMEYVEGDSLAALQREARATLPLPIALKILSDALLGLDAAHELSDANGRNLGVVHRDFSPQNILVGLDGSARLSDFGIAKAAIREGETQTGIVKGKVSYMAPEQATGKALDRRCDVWAAGVVAWELFAGQRLYAGSDPVATAVEIVTGTPRALRPVSPEISPELEAAVHYALAKELDRRCPSARAFRDCLLQAAGVSPASGSDVADYVRRLVGDKLEARRAAAERVLEQRQKPPARDALPVSTAVAPSPARFAGFKWAWLLVPAAALALYLARGSSVRAPQPALSTTAATAAGPANPAEPTAEPASLGATSVVPTPVSPALASAQSTDARLPTPNNSKRARALPARVEQTAKATSAQTPPPAPRPAASNPYE